MKQEKSTARWTRNLLAVGLLVLACSAFVGAQTVIPSVCFEPKPETFTRTATANFDNIFNFIELNQAVPHGFYAVVINPGGTTEERLTYIRTGSSQTLIHPGGNGLPAQTFQFPHLTGETILLTAEGDAVFGYNNTSGSVVTIPRGGSNPNYFLPGNTVYPSQPSAFQPGVHQNVVTIKVLAAFPVTWTLNNGRAISTASAAQGCGTITYQGRLSDGAAAANGQYDLQFTAYNVLTGGTAQIDSIVVENAQVTNGIFTVQLNFGTSFINNNNLKFLEIGVRPGAATGSDPFTLLNPRQPITSVPFAINAQNAINATNATNATNVSGGIVQLPLTSGAPPNTVAGGCGNATQFGNMKVDAPNFKLYVCMQTGWKAFVPQ